VRYRQPQVWSLAKVQLLINKKVRILRTIQPAPYALL
jgi:hypothetical protein